MFIYLTYKLHVNMAGHALAGFVDTKRKVYSPNLDAIKGESSAELFNNVKVELFGTLGIKELQPNGWFQKCCQSYWGFYKLWSSQVNSWHLQNLQKMDKILVWLLKLEDIQDF